MFLFDDDSFLYLYEEETGNDYILSKELISDDKKESIENNVIGEEVLD